MSSSSDPIYLVFDLEATGLSTELDEIVEVAAIVCDKNWNELDAFDQVVKPSPAALERAVSNPIVLDMMTQNGLINEVANGHDLAVVERVLLRVIDQFTDGKVILAGSGVARFDYGMIQTNMPDLARRLEYFTADIGVVRRLFRNATGRDYAGVDHLKPHRAMEDALLHLAELRAFHAMFQQIGADLYTTA